MGNKQSATTRRRSCPARPQPASRGSRAKNETGHRRATVSQPVSPVQATPAPVMPTGRRTSAPATPQGVVPMWDAAQFNSIVEAARENLPAPAPPADDPEPQISTEEKERMVLERQFAILLQIQHDIANAARENKTTGEDDVADISPVPSRSNSSSAMGAVGDSSVKTSSDIKQPLSELDYDDVFNSERVCSICLEDLNSDKDNPSTALLCYHVYHLKCISSWRAKGSQECPLCGAATV